MSEEKKADPSYPADFFARLFNLTPRRVQQLAKDGVIPRAGRGEYPLLASVRGYVDFLQKAAAGQNRKTFDKGERERLASEQADKVAIENATKRGELVRREDVEQVVTEMVALLASQLDGVAGRVANEVAATNEPSRAREIILREHRRIRTAYADGLAELAQSARDAGSDGEPDGAAAGSDAGSVGESKPAPSRRKRRARTVAD